jgi:hypothetical protein
MGNETIHADPSPWTGLGCCNNHHVAKSYLFGLETHKSEKKNNNSRVPPPLALSLIEFGIITSLLSLLFFCLKKKSEM